MTITTFIPFSEINKLAFHDSLYVQLVFPVQIFITYLNQIKNILLEPTAFTFTVYLNSIYTICRAINLIG